MSRDRLRDILKLIHAGIVITDEEIEKGHQEHHIADWRRNAGAP
jgi:hypothetical protein